MAREKANSQHRTVAATDEGMMKQLCRLMGTARVGLSAHVLTYVYGCKAGSFASPASRGERDAVSALVPYDEASRLLGNLTGVGLGSERMPTVTNHTAAGLTVLDVPPSRAEIERRMAEVAAGRLRRPVLVLGMDGA